jgi:hypothetical protein
VLRIIQKLPWNFWILFLMKERNCGKISGKSFGRQ